MDKIYVTSEDLISNANLVLGQKEEMQALFGQMQRGIRSMNSYWDSPAGRAAARQFETLTPVFAQYSRLVENYAQYLKQTAAAYQENEAALSGV